VVLFAFGAWLAWSALAQRRRVIAARRAGTVAREGEAAGNAQLSMTGEIMRPVILFALVYVALKSVFAYVVLDAGRWVSWFDLAGYLFLLAAYGGWVVVRTRYREVPTAATAPPVDAPAGDPPRSAPVRVPESVA
jgi:hypothetical protein